MRDAADTYIHTGEAIIEQTVDEAEAFVAAGSRPVRLQTAQPGFSNYGSTHLTGESLPGAPYPNGLSARDYLRVTPELFRAARDRLPEVRAASSAPIAAGELATSMTDATRMVLGGGGDLIRYHVSAIGGFTAARKLAVLAELTGVRTAWHAPSDTSPVGAAANVTLDITSAAFGIQAGHVYPDAAGEVVPGTLEITSGWLRPNDAPGWGIDLGEQQVLIVAESLEAVKHGYSNHFLEGDRATRQKQLIATLGDLIRA